MAEAAIRTDRQALFHRLFPAGERPSMKTWTILDCARDEQIYGHVLQTSNQRCCLFAGALDPELAVAAPHLVALDPDDRLTATLLNRGWGRAWGIFLRSDAPMGELRRHFRTFLRVRGPEGQYLLFRYYDPRVLSVYLPTCTPGELNAVFGATVRAYFTEQEDGDGLTEYRFDGQKLIQS